MQVRSCPTRGEVSAAAAEAAAQIMREAIALQGRAHRGDHRQIRNSGSSKLSSRRAANWRAMEAFHLCEYAGMPPL